MWKAGLFGACAMIGAAWALAGGAQRETEPAQASNRVTKFGAVGDGQTDDTDALQRAIDGGTGAVYLPRGVYRLTRSLVIDLDRVGYTSLFGSGVATLRMEAAGPAVQVVGTHFASADPGGFQDNVWQRQRMPLIDGLAIEGRHADATGIEAIGTMQLTLTRLHLRGLLHGVRLAKNNRNVAISDCHIYENRGVGIYYDEVNLHQSNISNCHISYNQGGGIVSRGGNVRNVHITGCDLESNMGPAALPTANVLIDCTSSRYGTAEVAITGCTIQHNHASPNSANIRILGRSLPSEQQPVVREGHVTITGNVLSDVQVNVHLRECRGVVVTGNTLWQGYQHNLLLENCSHLVLAANNLDRNPRYEGAAAAGADNGVVLRGCEDSTISGLHVVQVRRSPAGIVLDGCRRINLTQCTVLDCDQAGLLLRDVQYSRVSDCLIRDDRESATSASILLENSPTVTLSDNQLHPPLTN